MEILGDAVLQLVITDMLFKKYKDSNEGRITIMRQNLVNKNNLRNYIQKFENRKRLFMRLTLKLKNLIYIQIF